MEEQDALKYEQQLQEIVAKQIEMDVYASHGYSSPYAAQSTNGTLTWVDRPNGGILSYTQVGLTQVLQTYLSEEATERLVKEKGKRLKRAESIDSFTQASVLFSSAAEALFRLSLGATAVSLAVKTLTNAYIVWNSLPQNVANGNACAFIMVMYIPSDNVTVTTVHEWRSYPNISASDEGNYNITFTPF